MTIEHLIRDEAYRVGEGNTKLSVRSVRRRKKKRERTLSIKVENQSILYNCWHCQANGVVSLEERYMPAQRSNKVALAVKHDWDDLSKNVIDWLSKRGISEETARTAKIKSGQHYIRSIGKEVECVVFPYMNWYVCGEGSCCAGQRVCLFGCASIILQYPKHCAKGRPVHLRGRD